MERLIFLRPGSKFRVVFEKSKISLYTSKYHATLSVDGATIAKHRPDIEAAPTDKLVMQWFQLILNSKPSATMSVEERPTWCASRYNNAFEYRKVKEKEFPGAPVRYPFQTFKFKHFITWEKWASDFGRSLEYYKQED